MSTLLHLPFNQESRLPSIIYDQSGHGLIGIPSGTAALSTTQKKYGNASLALATSTANKVDLGTCDDGFVLAGVPFTISFWVYLTAYNSNGGRLLSTGGGVVAWNATTGIHLLIQSTATGLSVQWWNGSSNVAISSTAPLNTWTHVEFGFDGSTRYLFKDGVLDSSAAATIAAPSSSPRLMLGTINGEVDGPNQAFSGYVDDLLIDKGACLHTASFTPAQIAYTPRSTLLDVVGKPYPTSAYQPPALTLKREGGIPAFKDTEFGGKGKLIGTTKIKGLPDMPVARRVVLHRQRDGVRVAETWSNAAGDYEFDFIDMTPTYFTVSFDHTGIYRGVIADGLTAVSM